MTAPAWRLIVAGPAARDLQALPAKAARAVVESFKAIGVDPFRAGKPLRFELVSLWSARRGPYRVIYRIDEAERRVTIVAVAHRASVYRRT